MTLHTKDGITAKAVNGVKGGRGVDIFLRDEEEEVEITG